MGSIGHELQHAVEVLSHRNINRNIRSSTEITLFYLNTVGGSRHWNQRNQKRPEHSCSVRPKSRIRRAPGIMWRRGLPQGGNMESAWVELTPISSHSWRRRIAQRRRPRGN